MSTVPEPHVLAVDDSIVDRAVISRLLCSSKYRERNKILAPILKFHLLACCSYHGGQWQESIGGSQSGSECAYDHHRLLYAGDDRVRPPQAGQGVGGAEGDPGGDHVVGELADENPAVPGGGGGGVFDQAGAAVGCVAPLQPRHDAVAHAHSTLQSADDEVIWPGNVRGLHR